MDDCIFCKIVKGEIPAQTVYENNDILAFIDINPVTEGHVLLIPKEHHRNMFETPDNILSNLITSAKKIGNSLSETFDLERVVLMVWGADVDHTHLHLIPKRTSDKINMWQHGKYEEGEIEKITEMIKNSIKK